LRIEPLSDDQLERVDAELPLNRLDSASDGVYLVAWDRDRPVAHARLTWAPTKLGLPEVQDVYVREELRRRGIATRLTRAVEREASKRGHGRVSLSVGIGNAAARALYERLGYADAGVEPEHVVGTIVLRGRDVAVDDTLLYLVKELEQE
jgi:ribosomal protein S18 acetylase RimI-like enzyme